MGDVPVGADNLPIELGDFGVFADGVADCVTYNKSLLLVCGGIAPFGEEAIVFLAGFGQSYGGAVGCLNSEILYLRIVVVAGTASFCREPKGGPGEGAVEIIG